jgi:hypothetical protein
VNDLLTGTYADWRIPTWSRTANSENDCRVIVFPFIANQCDEAEANKLSSHLCRFFSSNHGSEIAEPFKSTHGSETVFVHDHGFAK